MADGPLTNLANLRGRTDANGYLLVTFPSGGPTIGITSKYGFVGVNNGFGLSSTNTAIFGPDGGGYLLVSNSLVFINSATLQFGTGGTADGSLSRLGAASFALGNGGAGDFTGALKLTTLTLVGKVATYNNIATAGQGIPSIYGEAISAVLTTGATILTVAPATTTAGRYRVQGNLTTTSGVNTGTVQLTVDYKDSQGTTHTADIMPVINAAGAIAVTGTAASKEFHAIPWEISVDNTTTNIVVKSVITGSVNYTAQASVEQIG